MGDLPKATGRSIDVAGICSKGADQWLSLLRYAAKGVLVRRRPHRSLLDTRRGMHQELPLGCVCGFGPHGARKAGQEVRFKRKGLNNRASFI